MNELLNKILANDHYDPFQFLGVHHPQGAMERVVVRTLQPQAEKVFLVSGDIEYPMRKVHPDGLFEYQGSTADLVFPELEPFDYQYRIVFHSGDIHLVNDPYRFAPLMGEQDRYLFNFGTNYSLYNLLGAQLGLHRKVNGTLFRVWAPNARSVCVVGNFNGWDRRVHQMRVLGSSGIWELFIPGLVENELYRFNLKTAEGVFLEKSDPFQFFGEPRPRNASVVRDLDRYEWQDEAGRNKRNKPARMTTPFRFMRYIPVPGAETLWNPNVSSVSENSLIN